LNFSFWYCHNPLKFLGYFRDHFLRRGKRWWLKTNASWLFKKKQLKSSQNTTPLDFPRKKMWAEIAWERRSSFLSFYKMCNISQNIISAYRLSEVAHSTISLVQASTLNYISFFPIIHRTVQNSQYRGSSIKSIGVITSSAKSWNAVSHCPNVHVFATISIKDILL